MTPSNSMLILSVLVSLGVLTFTNQLQILQYVICFVSIEMMYVMLEWYLPIHGFPNVAMQKSSGICGGLIIAGDPQGVFFGIKFNKRLWFWTIAQGKRSAPKNLKHVLAGCTEFACHLSKAQSVKIAPVHRICPRILPLGRHIFSPTFLSPAYTKG